MHDYNRLLSLTVARLLHLTLMQPILLSRISSVMDAWLEITRNSYDTANLDRYSAAVFLIKNEDTATNMPPLPEQPPAPSKLNAAKKILSSAVSRVSSWVKQKAPSSQTQESQVLGLQEFDRPHRADTKRVPRSQRLAEAAEKMDGAGGCACC